MYNCGECHKKFSTQGALDQHLTSPRHVFECKECARLFGSQRALRQHMYSPVHSIKPSSLLSISSLTFGAWKIANFVLLAKHLLDNKKNLKKFNLVREHMDSAARTIVLINFLLNTLVSHTIEIDSRVTRCFACVDFSAGQAGNNAKISLNVMWHGMTSVFLSFSPSIPSLAQMSMIRAHGGKYVRIWP